MINWHVQNCEDAELGDDNPDLLNGHLVSVNLDEQVSKLGEKYLQRCFYPQINLKNNKMLGLWLCQLMEASCRQTSTRLVIIATFTGEKLDWSHDQNNSVNVNIDINNNCATPRWFSHVWRSVEYPFISAKKVFVNMQTFCAEASVTA